MRAFLQKENSMKGESTFMKKKIVIGLIAIGLFASFYAGYSVNNQPVVETITTPEGEQDIKKASQGEEPTEVENGKIVNNFQIQQGEEDTQDNPQGDIVVKEELPEFYEEMVYNEETGIYEPVYIPVGGSDTDQSKEGNPLEEMTPEEFDKWMLDTSDAPKPGDITPQKPTEDGNGNTNNQGNTDNQGNTGGNSGGSSPLTPEQQAELERIFRETGAGRGDDPTKSGGGTGRAPHEQSDVQINWDK